MRLMRLHDLLADLADAHVSGPTDIPITAIAYDSRAVRPGSLFVAITGFHADGHAYIPQALERGAVAVVVEGDRGQGDKETGRQGDKETGDRRQESELGEQTTQNSKLKTQNFSPIP